jgi:hypothetical protein
MSPTRRMIRSAHVIVFLAVRTHTYVTVRLPIMIRHIARPVFPRSPNTNRVQSHKPHVVFHTSLHKLPNRNAPDTL